MSEKESERDREAESKKDRETESERERERGGAKEPKTESLGERVSVEQTHA